jgi:RNA polymerase sigma factor (sigma-70 family)
MDMATSQMNEVIQHLRTAVLPRDLTDRQLLEAYVRRRDEAALAVLVQRHGPMVWGVCRRVLQDHHEAEDAFQATFLVLVRKAASIASPELLAGWLYSVAHHTALRARATAAKRKTREKQVTDMPEPAVNETDAWQDVQPVLDQELSLLPDKYRVVIVLCDLEGKTHKEAARQLGCPEGTVAGRLARARVMLAKRLVRHGIVLSGGAVGSVLSGSTVAASLPSSVVSRTLVASRLFGSGQAVSGCGISGKVVALSEGVLKTMFLNKVRTVTALLLMVLACSSLCGLMHAARGGGEPPSPTAARTIQTSEQRKTDRQPGPDGNQNHRVPIRGRVQFPDGKPAAGLAVRVAGAGYNQASFQDQVRTDRNGRYEVLAEPNQIYLLVIEDRKWAAPPQTGFAVLPGKPVEGINFVLRPATHIHGRVTVGKDRKPVSGQNIYFQQFGVDLLSLENVRLPAPGKKRQWVQPMIAHYKRTDADGRFEFFVGPGSYSLWGPPQEKVKKVKVKDERSLILDFHSPRPEKGRLTGQVVTGKPAKPVAGAVVEGIYRHDRAGQDLKTTTDAQGKFDVERSLFKTVLHACSADGKRAGVVEITADDKEATIPIQLLGSARGRVVGPEGKPLADQEIWYGVRVYTDDQKTGWYTRFGDRIKTDRDGRFTLAGLVVGQMYHINVTIEADRWRDVGRVEVKDATEVDLGNLTLQFFLPRGSRPTLEQRMAQAFQSSLSPRERFDAALTNARLAEQAALVVFADRSRDTTRQLYEMRYNDAEVRLLPFRVLSISTAPGDIAAARELAEKLKVPLEKRSFPLLCIVAHEGAKPVIIEIRELMKDGRIDRARLLASLEGHAPRALDARKILADALARAKREKKRVLVQESANWCGPCLALSRFLDRNRTLLAKDYLWVKIDRRWPHAAELMKEIRKDPRGGIPWFAILDAEGKILATSNGPDGKNIGFPSDQPGRETFVSLLRKTRQRLTDSEIARLRKDLQEH